MASLHIANRDVLRRMLDARSRDVPVVFVFSGNIRTPSGQPELIRMAVPFERVEPAINHWRRRGGAPRIALNVTFTRRDGQLKAILTRKNAPLDLSDCIGLHELHGRLPRREHRGAAATINQFTSQYQLCALFGRYARVTMDAADLHRPDCVSLIQRLGVNPSQNPYTGRASGLVRSDIIAVKDLVFREDRFVACGPALRFIVAEVEAKGGLAEVRRKLVDRVSDAMRLGVPPWAIYAYAIVPPQQLAGMKREIAEYMEARTRDGGPAIGGMFAWSINEIDLAYCAIVGNGSEFGNALAVQICEPLL